MGQVDDLSVSIVAANLQAIMGMNTNVLPPLPIPERAYLPVRKQYLAGEVIKSIEGLTDGARFRLGVVSVDICTPILSFVFGESQLGGVAAVVSLYRLAHKDLELTFLRAAKIGLHETGHLLGIGHCRAPGCLMGFSSNVEKLDALPLRFCSACEYEIGRRLRHAFGRK